MKYKKKPIVVEAMQFNGKNVDDVMNFLNKKPINPKTMITGRWNRNGNNFTIFTLEGPVTLRKGDYLIKGISNEFYPCDKGIFKKSYEQVK